MNDCYVYALVEPFNDVPFYFGKGTGDRAFVHGRTRDKHNKDKCRIINTIRSLELEHRVEFVATELSSEEALKLEKFCIERFRLMYPNYELTNKDNMIPDRTGTRMSVKAIEKIKNWHKRNKQIPWIKGKTIANGGLPSNHGELISAGMKK